MTSSPRGQKHAEVFVVGRFPPPADGQANMTALCADLLEVEGRSVHRVNTQPPDSPLHATPRFSFPRTLHFVGQRGSLGSTLAGSPGAPVLWHSISPARLGHWRDILVTVPAFAAQQPIAAVLHRAGFDKLFEHRFTLHSVRRLVERVRFFVFQNEHLAGPCRRWIPEDRIRTIPNTVAPVLVPDAKALKEKRNRRSSSSDALHLLYLSNFMPEKGYRDVLEAIGILRGRGVHVRATFAGGWPGAEERSAFESRIASLGLREGVRVLGPIIEPRDVAALHLSADLMALPTHHPTETQPIAVLEALGAGTPVIVTERDAFKDMLGPSSEAGVMVSPQRPARIADVVEEFVDPGRWLQASEAARARFDERFSPAAVGEAWNALVDEM